MKSIFSILLILVATVVSSAQAAPDTSVHVVTYLDVLPTQAAAARALLVQQTQTECGQQGCRSSELLQEQGRPNHFLLVEAWEDETGLETYRANGGYRAFRVALQPLIGSPVDERRARQVTPPEAVGTPN